jgi:glycosyltransferase involved in cell wall biosynthesis
MIISVIIPSYKPSAYLYDCLDSLTGQTFAADKFETIIVLNGCNEPYFSQVSKYIKKHLAHHFSLLQTDTPGVSNARNIGLKAAKGDYICFIDDDDWISPGYLDLLYSGISEETIIESNVKQIDEATSQQVPHFLTDAYERNLVSGSHSIMSQRSFLSSVCCKLIPRKLIGNTRFDTRYRLGEDSLFMFTISNNISSIRLAQPEAIYYVRRREGSASRSAISSVNKAKALLPLVGSYIVTWLRHPTEYNFPFFLSRVVATLLKFLHKNYK